MSEMHHFPKISYVKGNITVDINLDRFSKQFSDAQQWLGDRVLEDCRSLMPQRSGSMKQRSNTQEHGAIVEFPGPYARFQYGGKVMVDPDTGSPFSMKKGKILTDRKLNYSDPRATDHWFDEAKARYGESWINGVKKIGGGR